jgi:peptidoglycan/xylan/chitin deacetylase (PgdA/CDA1 family)
LPQSRREVEQLIATLVPFAADERERLLASFVSESSAPEMLSAGQLRDLQAHGVAIGSHGMSHAPIPRTPQVSEELGASRAALRNLTGTDIAALSFPHGVYDQNCAATARAFGYELLFTSDSVLNCVRPGQPLNDVLGRIPIYEQEIVGPDGRLRPERLAFSLFLANTR